MISLLYLKQNPKAFPAVVVCPAGVKFHWEHETVQFLGIRPAVCEGRKPHGYSPDPIPQLTIVNYDILRDWCGWLKRLGPKTVVLDECHYLASGRAKRTQAAKRLCRSVSHVLALSGTPLVNRPLELFHTLNIIDRQTFNSRWSFAQTFCGPKWTPWGWGYKGASNTEQLYELLSSTCMIRKRKAEVLSQLPDKSRRVFTVPMSRPEEYEQAERDFVGWLMKQDPLKANKAVRAEAVTKLGYLKRLAARLKLRAVVEWINEFLHETEEKLVVFCCYRKALQAIVRRCPVRSVVVDGSVTGKRRKLAIDQFQKDRQTRLFVGNIRAAGVGITLTAASTVAFAELDWVPGAHVQAEDRCHRIGQGQPVTAWYFVAHGTIEERLCEVIQQKQEVLSAVLDGGPVPEDLDVYTQLLREMRK